MSNKLNYVGGVVVNYGERVASLASVQSTSSMRESKLSKLNLILFLITL